MKVCEKVQRKGTTSYNEVADELVAEFSAADNHILPNESVRGAAWGPGRLVPPSPRTPGRFRDGAQGFPPACGRSAPLSQVLALCVGQLPLQAPCLGLACIPHIAGPLVSGSC